MGYLDLYLLPVRTNREADYQAMANLGKTVWLEHGALTYSEHRADDVPPGVVTSFPMSVKLEADEVLYVGVVTYRDRAHRDTVNALVMADPRFDQFMDNSPADMQRMIFGGFATVVGGAAL